MKMESEIVLHAAEPVQTIGVGDEVTIDGLQGRGMVTAVKGKRITVRYRNGLWMTRDKMYVHKVDADYVSPYKTEA